MQFFRGTLNRNQSRLTNTSHFCQRKNFNFLIRPQSSEHVPILRAQMLYIRPQTSIFLRIKHWLHKICIFYQMWTNNNFKKKRQGSEEIQTMDSSIERNFWTEAWYLGLVRQWVVKHRDSHEERTFEWTRWRKETWMLYNEARILVRIYLILYIFMRLSGIK